MDLTKIMVNKAKLIATLEHNRDEHQAIYDKAVKVYQRRAIEEIKAMLADAKNGVIRRSLVIPVPEVHSEDFDRAIDMLNWAETEEIELTVQEFATLVRNNWGWLQSFTTNTSSYTVGR